MAKTLVEEDLRLNLIVNGDDGRKKILDLKDKIKGLNNQLDAENAKLKDLERSNKAGSAQYKKVQQNIENLTKSIDRENRSLTSLERQRKIDTMTMSELQKHIKRVNLVLKETEPGTQKWRDLNEELRNSKKRFKELSDQSSKTGGILRRISEMSAGGVLLVTKIAAITRRIIQGVAKIMSSFADFEQENANLASILRVNSEEMARLTQNAKELGAKTEYSSTQVSGLQIELAKLGFTQREILNMTEPTLAFATAVGTDLASAAAFAGAGLRAFGLQSKYATDFLEVMAAATTRSALDFEKLQTSISIVGPIAKSFGLDARDTVSLLGVLSNVGFDASSAATALRKILLETAKDGGKVQKAVGGEVKSFDELVSAMERLREKGLDLNEANRLVGQRAASAFLALADGITTARDLRIELDGVNGELEEMHERRLNTMKGSVDLLKSAWDNFKISVGESAGWLKKVIDLVTASVELLNRALFRAARIAHKKEGFAGSIQEIADAGGDVAAYLDEQNEKVNAAVERSEKHWSRFIPFYRHITKRVAKAAEERKEAFEEAAAEWAEGDGFVGPVLPGSPGLSPNGDEDPDPNPDKKSWSLENDRTFLEAKLELTRQYNEGEIKDQETYNEKLLELEIAMLTARLALRKESGTDRLQLEQQLLEKVHQQQENARKKDEQLAKEKAQILAEIETDAAKKARAQEDARYAEEQKKYQGNAEMLELIEKKHRQNLSKIELDAQNQAMSRMQRAHEIERAELENHWLDRIAQAKKGSAEEKELRRQMNQELGALDLQYLNSLHTLLEHIVDTGEFEGIAIPEEQLDAFKKKLQEVIKQITETSSALAGESDGGFWAGTGNGELFGVRQDQWEQLFSNLSKGKFGAQDLQASLAGLGGIAQQGFQLASQAIAMTNAKEQEELRAYQKANETKRKDLQKRLDAGLMTQAQYDAEIEKMEAEQEAREEEMALRQAEREKRMNIVQAIINTALSVTKTLAQWGWPAGAVPAAIVGAMGAAQIAMMAATPVTGREQGGAFVQDGRPVRVRRQQDGRTFPARLSPDRRGFIDRPTVLVGENGSEYVIPSDALQNPSVRPFIDAIETARRSGRLRDLRLEAVLPRLAVAGRAAGGFFDDDAAAGFPGGSVMMPEGVRLSGATYQELLQALRRMNVIFSKPIKAEVTMLGRNGIVEKMEEYNRAQGRGRLG